MGSGWADWDTPRQPRVVLTPTGVQQARYCPRCCVERIFALPAPAEGETTLHDLALVCTSCRYRTGDTLTAKQTVLMMDRYKLSERVLLNECRVTE